MPKESRISYREDKGRKEKGLACWRVNISAKISNTGKRKVLFFRSKQDAVSKVRELQIILNNEGARAFEITSPEIESFFYARDNLLNYGVEFRRGIDVLIDLLQSGGDLESIREAYKEGKAVLDRKNDSLSFGKAAEEMVDLKQRILKRRPSTIHQIRVMINQVKKRSLWFCNSPLSEISPDDCRKMIVESFNTPKQQDDARRILSGVFSLGRKRGWCPANPMSSIEKIHIEEREIKALNIDEVSALFAACREPNKKELESGGKDLSSCIAPLALLVFGGIRPEEVRRLVWSDIDFEEGVVSVRSRASKTGGTRHVSMCDAMRSWLESVKQDGESSVCPPAWEGKWSELRKRAGWKGRKVWQEDALRHTFASYHAKTFKDFPLLQMEMGHGSAALLRQRYTNLSGVTEDSAKAFWNLMYCTKPR